MRENSYRLSLRDLAWQIVRHRDSAVLRLRSTAGDGGWKEAELLRTARLADEGDAGSSRSGNRCYVAAGRASATS